MILTLLLLLSIVAASVNSVLLHKASGKLNTVSFNMIGTVVWILILAGMNRFSLSITPPILIWGVLYGIVQMLFMLFKAKAMGTGPVSTTTLIGNCSLLLSTTVGVLVWHEGLSVFQVIGIALLIAAFFCCTYSKGEKEYSRMWLIYCCCFFVSSAGVGIIFKAFSKSVDSGVNDMMLVAAVTMLTLSGLVRLFGAVTRKNAKEQIEWKKILPIAIFCGLLSCAYNRLNVFLTGELPSAVFFPIFNGGVILLAMVLGTCVLKERLTKRQTIGILMGTAAVAVVGFLG